MSERVELLVSLQKGGDLWAGYAAERFKQTPEEEARAAELAGYDDLELARSLQSYVHTAREALRHQDFDSWETFMDLAEEYGEEIARRAGEKIQYLQSRAYVYQCGCVRRETLVVPFRRDAGERTFGQSGRCLVCLRKDVARRKAQRERHARPSVDNGRTGR